jgi:hypothetical protein
MTTLREAAQQALEALVTNHYAVAVAAPHKDLMAYSDAITALRAALEQPPCATQDCMPSKCSLAAQNTEQDRVLVEMEHALNEADAIMEEVDEETADAWRKRWGYLWGRTV